MAFTKQPTLSTYQTKTVGLIKELGSRDYTQAKDSYYLNAYAEVQKNRETQEQEIIAVKRAGTWTPIASVGSGGVRGMWHWKDQSKVFVSIGRDIYVYNADSQALITTITNVFASSAGTVGFTEFLYSSTVVKLVVSDGTEIHTIDSSNVVGNSVGHPAPHSPYIVFLDGYLFVVKSNSSSIYNSDQDNPLTWVGGDFIDAEMKPDNLSRIALLSNYIVAFGTESIEYFYDAANSSGSPLSRNDSPYKGIGFVGSFAQIGNKIYFVGKTQQNLMDVYLLEDFKVTPLSVDAIRRHLETSGTGFLGAIASFDGHDFYVMSTATATFAYDVDEKLWAKWSYKNNSNFPINNSFAYFGTWFTTTIDQSVNLFAVGLHNDSGVNFPMEIVTDIEYFDSYNRKSNSRAVLYADRVVATVLIQTSDNDYQTWSTGQSVSLDQDLPCVYRLGMFRRRAYKISYTGNQPLRLRKLEVDINLGNT